MVLLDRRSDRNRFNYEKGIIGKIPMSKKFPLVSVITPVYNGEDFLRDSIESILNQTLKDFEYIIIDDCSNDNTWQIIKKYSKEDERIKIYKNEKNLGIAGNRNRGLSLSNGKYIAWQDADDISFPDRLEKQCSILEKNHQIGIVGGYLLFFDQSGDISIRKYPRSDEQARKVIFRYSPVAQPSAMVRKICFDQVGLYDLKLPPAEDLDMSFRIGAKFKMVNIPQVLVRYRLSGKSATYTQLKKIEKSTLGIRWKNYRLGIYSMSVFDKIYNLLQLITLYLLPVRTRISLFNLIRNSNFLRVD